MPVDLGVTGIRDGRRQENVLRKGEMVNEAAVLVDDADALPHFCDTVPVKGRYILPQKAHMTLAGPEFEGTQADKRRLPGAGRSGKEVETAR